jgi:hypothetical protein
MFAGCAFRETTKTTNVAIPSTHVRHPQPFCSIIRSATQLMNEHHSRCTTSACFRFGGCHVAVALSMVFASQIEDGRPHMTAQATATIPTTTTQPHVRTSEYCQPSFRPRSSHLFHGMKGGRTHCSWQMRCPGGEDGGNCSDGVAPLSTRHRY